MPRTDRLFLASLLRSRFQPVALCMGFNSANQEKNSSFSMTFLYTTMIPVGLQLSSSSSTQVG
jgi:hypothetical protein